MERLAGLPKTISAQPLDLRMEELEAIQATEKEKLQALQTGEGIGSGLSCFPDELLRAIGCTTAPRKVG